jgi:hypothetical protein
VLGPVRRRRWEWVILPTPRWRLATPPSRPLAAFPTFVSSLPRRFRSGDYRTNLCHSRSDVPLAPSSGHHGFSPAFWADVPSVGVGARWRLRCGVVCVADPVVAGRRRGLDLPAADQSPSLSDADHALLRVGGCSDLVRPDLGQVLLVMVCGHVVGGASLRVCRWSFMRLVVWRHVLRVVFCCWLGAPWSEVGVVGD